MKRKTGSRRRPGALRRDEGGRDEGGRDESGRTTTSAGVHRVLGGYRLLRTIGDGGHATIHVGTGAQGQVVVKAFRDVVDAGAIAREIACLCAVESPHVVRAVDVARAPGQPPCLILQRLDGPSIAALVRTRDDLEPGEAVTIGVSVIRGVRAIHAAGWSHGALTPARVKLDATGCPALLGLGSAARATPARWRDDWGAVVVIMELVLTHCDGFDSTAVTSAMATVRGLAQADPADESEYVAVAERALFALSPAAPISQGPTSPRIGRSNAVSVQRRDTVQRSAAVGHPDDDAELDEIAAERTVSPSPSQRLAWAALGMMEGELLASLLRRGRTLARTRKRPLILGAAGALAITALALVLVPEGGSAGRPAAAVSAATPPPSPRTDSRPGATVPPGSTSPPAQRTPDPAPTTDPLVDPATDPVRAAAELFGIRSACFRQGDAGCLSRADQAGSPLLTADTALLASGATESQHPAGEQLSLVEDLGDASLVAIAPDAAQTTKPASVLLIKTEAGWRLRAVYEN